MDVSIARDTVRVDGIEVDRTPVTNARYESFVRETGHRPPRFWPNARCPASLREHPVVGVDFFDAIAFALWAGGRLPSEMDWVLASGLAEPRAYVWGDRFDNELCNTVRSGIKGTTPVGAYPPAPSGCVDMMGNVWEMTCNAHPTADEAIIVKGGSWYDFPGHAKLDTQFSAPVNRTGNAVGFRLVYDDLMRLPEFLDEELVARCIAHRRAQANPTTARASETSSDAREFDDVVSHLRKQAEATLPGIESPQFDPVALDEALDALDALELDPPATQTRPVPAPIQNGLLERAQDWIVERPLPVLTAALVLSLGVVFLAALGPDDTARSRRAAGDGNELAARLENPTPARIARRREQIRGVDHAIADLDRGQEEREEAERYLIHHREDARELIEAALRVEGGDEQRASLRYVLAVLVDGESPSTPVPLPEVLSSPPREGLVFFFHELDDFVSDELVKVRCTAAAEGLALTVVYTGTESIHVIANAHRTILRGAKLYEDKNRTLSQLWGASRVPCVAGVRQGGLAFLSKGHTRRALLAEQAALLAKP